MKVNNTNPLSLIGLCLACIKNWMNKSHEITRICLEHENKITNSLLFYCDMYPLYWTPSKEGIFGSIIFVVGKSPIDIMEPILG